MRKVKAGGVTVDRCPTCAAVWVDVQDLKRLKTDESAASVVDAGAGTRVVTGKSRTLACPRDGTVLATMRDPAQGHIEYDACRLCGGVLFDAGELKDLADYSLVERLKGLFG